MASPTTTTVVKTFEYTTSAAPQQHPPVLLTSSSSSILQKNSTINTDQKLIQSASSPNNNNNAVDDDDDDVLHHHSTLMDDSEINVFDAHKYFNNNNNDHHHHPKENRGILSLSPTNQLPIDSVSRVSSVSSVDGYYGTRNSNNNNFSVRSFHATTTPTASSEASWNSQTGLLTNPPGSIPVSLRNPLEVDNKKRYSYSSSGRKWFFCRNCPCSGKKSVQVEEGITIMSSSSENREIDAKTQSSSNNNNNNNNHKKSYCSSHRTTNNDDDQTSENLSIGLNPVKIQSENHFVIQHRVVSGLVGGFSFPVLKNPSHTVVTAPPPPAAPKLTNSLPKTSVIISPVLVEEAPPRESLEVFQPPESSNLRKSIEDDVGSDASSDLFEIESFSTQTIPNYPIYRRRDSLDDAQTLNARRLAATSNGNTTMEGIRSSSLDEPMTPRTDCYAPSEVSIDWSVTTAEGFDKTSVSIAASEIEEFTAFRGRLSTMEKSTEAGTASASALNSNSHAKKKLGNGLLSCRHEKSVNVGPHPLRCMQLEGPPLQLISTSSHVSIAANRPPKPSLPPASSRSHPARLSLAFAA